MMGFLQFLAPTISFMIGLAQGESFTPLRAVSFALIWGGAGVFVYGAGAIVEVPASTVQVGTTNVPIAGGGYFRLLPYAFTRWGIGRVNAAGEPVVFLAGWSLPSDMWAYQMAPLCDAGFRCIAYDRRGHGRG